MEFRIIGDAGREAVERIWAQCFEGPEEPFFKWFFSNYYNGANAVGGYAGGNLAAFLNLMPYRLWLRGRWAPAAYIVGVAVAPEQRGRGVARHLLAAGLEECRRRGVYACVLMPSKVGFYLPLQWAVCYHQLRYSVSLPDLRAMAWPWDEPGSAPAGEIAPLADDATAGSVLGQVYKRFTAGRHGYALRGAGEWERMLAEHRGEGGRVYVLRGPAGPAGYVLYLIKERRLLVREMAHVSFAAQQALIRFLAHHRSEADIAEWNAPLDDSLCFRLYDPSKSVTLNPFVLGRVVDVGEAIGAAAYPLELEADFSLRIEDRLAPWNCRAFGISVAEGRALVTPYGGSAADVVLSAEGFALLYFGRLAVREVLAAGLGRTEGWNGEAAATALAGMYPRQENYINEYY